MHVAALAAKFKLGNTPCALMSPSLIVIDDMPQLGTILNEDEVMLKTIIVTTVGALCVASTVHASSNSAWNALFAKANGTCIGQSRMVSPEATAPVLFDDATGKLAILLREKNAKTRKMVNLICLYDKKSGKASIAEYERLGQ
jgi:hypothetical protein